MSDIVIKTENLGKKYVIGHQAQRGGYTALRDVLMQNARTLWSKTKDLATGKPVIQGDTTEEVWALKDVNFEVHRGEALGIIGRNGAGKSTLLKVLSRITEPTAGRVTIKGRVASLLEVGTGFHPELSGRENIYLNGTILGMTRAEIKRKFDEIVSFAEVERYLDTPVKRYSSGMYVRLAFAVAAHLDPEILVVDEVLAVGDAQFQKKCLGKMNDVARGGRTVLFVSHNMAAVSALCSRAILLKDGTITCDANVDEAINDYLSSLSEKAETYLDDRADRRGDGTVRLCEVWIEDRDGQRVTSVRSGDDVTIVLRYKGDPGKKLTNMKIAFALRGPMNARITDLSSSTSGFDFVEVPLTGVVRCTLPRLALNSGTYLFNAFCSMNGIVSDHIADAGKIHVEAGDFFETGKLPGGAWGPFLLQQRWSIQGEA